MRTRPSRRWSRCRRCAGEPHRPRQSGMGDGTPARDPERALGLAYAYLNRRERTEAEVRRHLEARGLDAAAAETAVMTLRDQGYLDDVRFARLFAQDKRHLDDW